MVERIGPLPRGENPIAGIKAPEGLVKKKEVRGGLGVLPLRVGVWGEPVPKEEGKI